ncbi:MAG: molybdopterin cofactor-binding domain-containing protein [Bacteroidota bacterium]
MNTSISRRKFLVRSGIGVSVALGVSLSSCGLVRRKAAGILNEIEYAYRGDTNDPTIWFEVMADNQIILKSPKVEMGQGVFTALAQIAAEELEVDVENIKVVHAETQSGNIDKFGTGGSTSIPSLWTPLRELAATMRQMLVNAAAKQWSVDADQLTAQSGLVQYGNQQLTYGEIVQTIQEWDVPSTPKLKPKSSYQSIGKPVKRVDLTEKVTGAPIYGMDAALPNMLYAAVLRSPKIDATLETADTKAASQMPGVVKIVQEKDFVAVVADSYMEAENAKQKIKATWKTTKVWQTEDIEAELTVGRGSPVEIQKEGNASKILKENEATVIQREYWSPIGAHAQIEPNAAVAHVEGDHATIILSTQVTDITRSEVADRLGFKAENVNIVPTFLGGGFGRRLHTPHAMVAAVLSKSVGRPVKYVFSRQEEFQHDNFRPPTHHILRATLTADGDIEAISHDLSSGDVAFGSSLVPNIGNKFLGADLGAWRGGMIQYEAIPNHIVTSWRAKLPFSTSWWRGLGLLPNSFAIETFMDELAEQAGRDPIEFRLAHIKNDDRGNRLRAVIEAVAERANWKSGAPDGRALGFAASTDVNTPCAQIAEVSVEEGRIKVHKMTCAIDPGIAINPDQIRAQCEGSIVMGMSAAMYEEMFVKDNELRPVIYGPYQMAMMRDTPKEIDVVILENAETPGGLGEPPMGPVGAAIANAVYQLTGERITRMPFGHGNYELK